MGNLEKLVRQAVEGDKKALEEVVIQIQDSIYNLAIRMLWHPDDAKDATQEILIKIITNLSAFKHKSAFKTWVYRLATNNLINFKKKYFKKAISFDEFGEQLNQNLSDGIAYTTNEAEQNLLVQEAKVSCSNAMLQCLNEDNRLTYIIGEILEFNSKEAAIILNITPENFRKKLSRTRQHLHSFLNNNCGIVNAKNKCRCTKHVDSSIKIGLIQPTNLLFTKNKKSSNLIGAIESMQKEVSLYQSNPEYSSPEILLKEVTRIVTREGKVSQ